MNILDKLQTIFSEDFIVRFNQDELDQYVSEGLTEYSRRSGAFIHEYELKCADNGVVALPSNVLSVVSCNGLPLSSWRSIASLHGGQWYNKTSREAECYITDFDSCNQLRLFPIPENKDIKVSCVVSDCDNYYMKIEDAVVQFVCGMMLLREYNGEANAYFSRFDKLSNPAVNRTTSVTGIRNKGVWF